MIEDQRQELIENFVWPAISADLIFEDRYLLGTALARPCIVRGMIDVAKRVGAGECRKGERNGCKIDYFCVIGLNWTFNYKRIYRNSKGIYRNCFKNIIN